MDINKPFPLFLFGFLVSIAYIPGIIGAAISTTWFILIIAAALLTAIDIYNKTTLNLSYGLVFIGYAVLSLIWTVNFNIGFFFLLQIIALACMFQLGEQLKDPRPIFHGLSLGFGFSSLLALLQYFYNYKGIYTLETTNGTVAGLFINPNIYSEISAVLLIALIALKLFWWIPVTIPGLVLVPSRSALVALGVCGLIWLWNKNKIAVFGVLVLIACVIFYKTPNLNSIQERLDMWADTINGLTLFGNGVGSFEIQYPLNAIYIDTSIARPKYAHNDLLQLVFEFGIGSLLLIPLIYRMVLSGNTIVICIGTISLFTHPFHVPMLAFIGFLFEGHVSFNNATVRISGNSRGPNLSKRIKNERYSTI